MSGVNLNLNRVPYLGAMRSKPINENFSDIENGVNNIQDQIDVLATPPAGTEVTLARDYHSALRDRLRSASQASPNVIITGGVVSMNADPTKVDITAGEAIVGGVACKWNAATSAAISYTSSNTRYDVVVINSDNTLSIVGGAQAAAPVLPDVAGTQRALWVLTVSTSAVALGWDARDQGARYFLNGREQYQWKIHDAADAITNGQILIGVGSYYEEVDLSGKSFISLVYADGAKHYRRDDTSYCIKSDNGSGSETQRTRIFGGNFYGNGKAGTCELLFFDYADNVIISDCYFDGNASSTATHKNSVFTNCDGISISRSFFADRTIKIDRTNTLVITDKKIVYSMTKTEATTEGFVAGDLATAFGSTTIDKIHNVEIIYDGVYGKKYRIYIYTQSAATINYTMPSPLTYYYYFISLYNNADTSSGTNFFNATTHVAKIDTATLSITTTGNVFHIIELEQKYEAHVA